MICLRTTIAIARVWMYMAALLPLVSEGEAILRWHLSTAIVYVTGHAVDQLALAKIARFESHYQRDVADCDRMGAAGDRSAWQVVPRSREDAARLCVTYVQDARLALERIDESTHACWHLPAADRLAIYARGKCDSDEGRALSRQRWPTTFEQQRFNP